MVDQPEHLADRLNSDNRRSDHRQSVLKGAKMLFNDSIIDCLVISVSEVGARVRTAAIMPVPDRIILRLSDGATFTAVRRWTQGMETGFSFEGVASLPDETLQIAWRIYEVIRAATIRDSLRLLEAASFFGDLALQNVAEQAEAGLRTLEKELAKRVRNST